MCNLASPNKTEHRGSPHGAGVSILGGAGVKTTSFGGGSPSHLDVPHDVDMCMASTSLDDEDQYPDVFHTLNNNNNNNSLNKHRHRNTSRINSNSSAKFNKNNNNVNNNISNNNKNSISKNNSNNINNNEHSKQCCCANNNNNNNNSNYAELRSDVEDLKLQLQKIELILKEDMKNVLELLETKQNTPTPSNTGNKNNTKKNNGHIYSKVDIKTNHNSVFAIEKGTGHVAGTL